MNRGFLRNRGQSELIGTILLLALVIGVITIGGFAVVNATLNDITPTDPLVSLDAEDDDGAVLIYHTGGEELDADQTRVQIAGLEEQSIDEADEFLGGDTVQPGDEATFDVESASGPVDVLVISEEFDHILLETTVDLSTPAEFQVEIDVAASTLEVPEGDEIEVVATVETDEPESETQTVEAVVDDTVQDETAVEVGEEPEEIALTFDSDAAFDGEDVVTEIKDDESDSAPLSVETAEFDVEIDEDESTLSAVADEQDIDIVAILENTGGADGAQTVTATVGEDDRATKSDVSVDAGTEETVDLSFTAEEADDGELVTVDAAETDDDATLEVFDQGTTFVREDTTNPTCDESLIVDEGVEIDGDEDVELTCQDTISFRDGSTIDETADLTIDSEVGDVRLGTGVEIEYDESSDSPEISAGGDIEFGDFARVDSDEEFQIEADGDIVLDENVRIEYLESSDSAEMTTTGSITIGDGADIDSDDGFEIDAGSGATIGEDAAIRFEESSDGADIVTDNELTIGANAVLESADELGIDAGTAVILESESELLAEEELEIEAEQAVTVGEDSLLESDGEDQALTIEAGADVTIEDESTLETDDELTIESTEQSVVLGPNTAFRSDEELEIEAEQAVTVGKDSLLELDGEDQALTVDASEQVTIEDGATLESDDELEIESAVQSVIVGPESEILADEELEIEAEQAVTVGEGSLLESDGEDQALTIDATEQIAIEGGAMLESDDDLEIESAAQNVIVGPESELLADEELEIVADGDIIIAEDSTLESEDELVIDAGNDIIIEPGVTLEADGDKTLEADGEITDNR